jgi:hypothetical protein
MTTIEQEQNTKLGLAGLDAATLPCLEVVVSNTQRETIGHIEAQLTALIVSPLNRVLYMEAVCSSDSGAHALMGAVTDARGSIEFRYRQPGRADTFVEILPPDSPLVSDARLTVPGWSRQVHHVAMLDRSGDLILSQNDEALWRKLREKMTCPTLEEWGQAVMPEVCRSGLLLECEAFGVPEEFHAFVLSPEAQAAFDNIIAAHVRRIGGLQG